MRWGQLAFAAVILLGCVGGATGSPLIPTLAGVSLRPQSDIAAVRGRHGHHRGYFWGFRLTDRANRDDTDALTSQPNIDIEATRWRRHRRDYGWNDRRSDSIGRDDTDASSSNASRLPATDFVRRDLRRRRGWVDPPPAR